MAALPECLAALGRDGEGEFEDAAFGLLQAWLQGLYTVEGVPSLAEDARLRRAALGRLQSLAALSAERPALAIGVGQMLFLYFWWGPQPPLDAAVAAGDARALWTRRGSGDNPCLGAHAPVEGDLLRGPSAPLAKLSAELHLRSLQHAGCRDAATTHEAFLAKKCPWRWRFLLMISAELGRQLALGCRSPADAVAHLRAAEGYAAEMRSLPFFAGQAWQGPYATSFNADFFPWAENPPVWPMERWPDFATFLEANAHVFLEELLRVLEADSEQELFRVAMVQQTEFAVLQRDWATVDLMRKGRPSEGCRFAPASCALLQDRPEVDERCGSVPDAGVSWARLWPGSEVKPHFATDPRLAVHLGLVTPPGASMVVGWKTVTWQQGRALVFDDTYAHSVRHEGSEPRFVLLSWTCHPCDAAWRAGLGEEWQRLNPLPPWCGGDTAAPRNRPPAAAAAEPSAPA